MLPSEKYETGFAAGHTKKFQQAATKKTREKLAIKQQRQPEEIDLTQIFFDSFHFHIHIKFFFLSGSSFVWQQRRRTPPRPDTQKKCLQNTTKTFPNPRLSWVVFVSS